MKFFKILTPVLALFLALTFVSGCSEDDSDPVVGPNPPAAPTLNSPTDDASFGAETVTFGWNDVADAVTFQVKISADPNLSTAVVTQDIAATEYAVDLSTFQNDGTFYWGVRCANGSDEWSGWSLVHRFTLDRMPPALPAPTLTAPSQAASFGFETVAFDWSDVVNAAHYQFQISNDPNYGAPEVSQMVTESAHNQSLAGMSDGTYFWRVRGQDAQNNYGAWSALRSFMIDTAPPTLAAPTLTAPNNDMEYGKDMVIFDWSDVANVAEYVLQVSMSIDFADLDINMTLAQSEYELDLTTLPQDGDYYWRVAGKDASANMGTWSDVRTFNLETLVVLMGTIRENLTLHSNKDYLLSGGVFIGSHWDTDHSVTLSIQAGTTIYGESATDGMIVITRGGKIMAEGTVDAPVVFTSDKPEGSRSRADWGGVIINGWAPLNTGEAQGEGSTGPYGGNNPNDDSGVLNYVRIEFAGREISPDNELNGLALQGVGSGTVIDYVQVHMNKDDGIEFFGGTAQAKHIYVTGCADDQFDWTDGWTGKGQFWICQQYGDDADQGIEADNNGEDNSALPRSMPMIYNLTLIGDKAGAESDIGMLLREGTGAIIRNAIVMNFGDCGIDIDHESTFNNAWDGAVLTGNLVVDNSIFFDNAEVYQTGEDDEAGFPFTSQQFIESLNSNNQFQDPNLTAPYDKGNPNYMPGAGSIALSGHAAPPADGFFDQVDYIGAVGSADNWLAGWTTSAPN